MDKLKFLAVDNAVADAYSNVGVFIPVGAAVGGSSAKPSITPLASTSTTTTITANFNVSTFEDITAMSYTVNSGSPTTVASPVKGVNTIELTGLTENSGPYVIALSVTNENGTTTASQTIDLQVYTNWASSDEILAGNKAISEGEEVIGTIPTKTDSNMTVSGRTVTIPSGYYAEEYTKSVSSDYIIPEGTTTTSIDTNGTTTVDVTSYASHEVTVAVPNGTETLSVTENGTYTPTSPNVGFSEVTVNVSGGSYNPNYMTITSQDNTAYNEVGYTLMNGKTDVDIEYSFDGETWTRMPANTNVTLPAGDNTMYLRGNNPNGLASYSNIEGIRYTKFYFNSPINLGGSVQTLLGYDREITAVPAFAFSYLFYNCYISSIDSGFLPATTLGAFCYHNMFLGCSGLTTLPSDLLPATTLADDCYNTMFANCSGLTTLPSGLLPATTLYSNCYTNMFYGCTGLTTLPSGLLPATTLANYCYNGMFYYCSGLTTLPSDLLPATTLEVNCYGNMFYGCTGLTTLPSGLLPATTLYSNCYTNMFYGCTGLTTLPSGLLPATTLEYSCYSQMFSGCSGLTTLPSDLLPATTLADSCYYLMFSGCAFLTTAPELPATTLIGSCYAYMFQNCPRLNNVKIYATSGQQGAWEQDGWCPYSDTWLEGVAGTGDFYNLGTMSIPTDNVSGIPTGWTLHTSL